MPAVAAKGAELTDLSDAYANMAYIPDGAAYPARWAAAAAAFRARSRWRREAYGPGARQQIDMFTPQGVPRGLVVFVHGGYWLQFSPEDWSHLAAGSLAAGWAVALPGYDLAPAARLSEITLQVALAVQVAARHIGGPLRLCGHSAGGHLVARMLCPGVLPADLLARVAQVVPISPLADLAPLLRTAMNADLRLDAEEARAESPLHCPPPAQKVHVWVGAEERPAFLGQARSLALAWGAALSEEPGRHHFNVLEGLAQPGSALLQALLGERG